MKAMRLMGDPGGSSSRWKKHNNINVIDEPVN
jgi:hypothetical protein